ncbi:MAG TPA: ABC transporter permease [Aggregatilineaceae bacterium]|nr:ABC transporter permease [Aggregatilineaceae bacterium]
MDSIIPGRPEPSRPPAKLFLRTWQALSLPMLLFFAVPVVLLFTRTGPLEWLDGFRQPQVYQAIAVSLKTSLVSLLITILAGTPVAYLMGRQQFRFKKLVDTLIDLPIVLPPSVAGVALLLTLGRRGVIGESLEALGIHIAFTSAAVVIAQVFISAPFYVRSASLGFGSIDSEIEQAAQLDGASHAQVFQYIMLPLARPAFLGGCMMSWARALGEFGATIIFAGNFPGRTQTMPIAIYLGFEVDLNIALTLSVILVAISFAAILLVKSIVPAEERYSS